MKFAIVPINGKQVENNIYIRCVLIEFKEFDGTTYKGTRFLDNSPYFNNVNNALQYKFEDNGYTLIQDGHRISEEFKMIKRPYHVPQKGKVDNRYYGVIFEADTDEEALDYFKFSPYYDTDSLPIEGA